MPVGVFTGNHAGYFCLRPRGLRLQSGVDGSPRLALPCSGCQCDRSHVRRLAAGEFGWAGGICLALLAVDSEKCGAALSPFRSRPLTVVAVVVLVEVELFVVYGMNSSGSGISKSIINSSIGNTINTKYKVVVLLQVS